MGALTSKPYTFTARPWELKQHFTFDFFDTLASKIRLDYRGETFLRVLPTYDYITDEEFINDRARFFYDILNKRRITKLFYKEGSAFSEISWEKFFFLFLADYLQALQRNAKMESVSNKYLDLYSASIFKLFTMRMLTNNAVGKRSFVTFVDFSSFFLDVREVSKFKDVFLVGLNLRFLLPLLNLKLRKQVQKGKVRVFSFFENICDSFFIFSLGLSINSFWIFLSGRSPYFRHIHTRGTSMLEQVLFLLNSDFYFFYDILKAKFDQVFVLFKNIGDLSLLQTGGVSKGLLLHEASSKKQVSDVASSFLFLGDTAVALASHPFDSIKECKYILPSFTIWEQQGFFLNLAGSFFENADLYFLTGKTFIRKEADFFYAFTVFFELFLRKINSYRKEDRSFLAVTMSGFQNYQESFHFQKDKNTFTFLQNSLFLSEESNIFKLDNLTRSSKFLSLAVNRFRNDTVFF